MATIHIESEINDIADKVLMPGDPLRAKYIADNFLTNVKVVNNVRNMTAYTGFYKDKKVTVFPSGMGIPSIGIYGYELYKFYNVNKIIRIGTCGSYKENIKLFDLILADKAYSLSNFANLLDGNKINIVDASHTLTNEIYDMSQKMNYAVNKGLIITSEVFDAYLNHDEYMKHYPTNLDYLGIEMESFALFYLAKYFKKEAACLLTVVDSIYDKRVVTSEEREKSLNDMIKLALETI